MAHPCWRRLHPCKHVRRRLPYSYDALNVKLMNLKLIRRVFPVRFAHISDCAVRKSFNDARGVR